MWGVSGYFVGKYFLYLIFPRWIHAQCEDLDGEEYQVLSYLPDSVSYICK